MATNAQHISAVSVHWQRFGLPPAYKGVWGKTRAFTCYGKAGLYKMPKTSKGGEGFMKWYREGMEKVPHISQEECKQLLECSKRGKGPVVRHIQSSWGKTWFGYLVDLAAVWNITITKMSGYIASPYYPGNSPNNFHCTWQIRLPVNYVVRLNFLMFDFMDYPKCEDGFLQIRDGADPSSQSLGRFCGYKFPKVLESSANEMMIEYRASTVRSKFKISYSGRKSEYFAAVILLEYDPVYTRANCFVFVTFVSEFLKAFTLILMNPE